MFHTRLRPAGTFILACAAFALVLAGCDSTGANGGGDSDDDGSGGSSTTCTATGDFTVTWGFSGSYSDSVSVATTWVKPSGEFSDPSDTKYATFDPKSGATLLTETLPACSGASINLTALDQMSDDNDTVALSNITLSISTNGSVAGSVDLNGTVADGSIHPSSGGLTIVVGQ